jgi:hypothetical protein
MKSLALNLPVLPLDYGVTSTQGICMKRTVLSSSFVLVAILAFGASRARADEITVGGTTASNTPSGSTFTSRSFNGTTSGGFAGFSNLGSYTLSSSAGNYNNAVVDLTITFTVPTGINGGASSTFVANVFGNVNTNSQGGVSIVFTNPSQNFSFSNGSGSGSYSFTVNSVSLNPGGTTPLSGFVSGGSIIPAPEPSAGLLLGVGLLLLPLVGLRKLA